MEKLSYQSHTRYYFNRCYILTSESTYVEIVDLTIDRIRIYEDRKDLDLDLLDFAERECNISEAPRTLRNHLNKELGFEQRIFLSKEQTKRILEEYKGRLFDVENDLLYLN